MQKGYGRALLILLVAIGLFAIPRVPNVFAAGNLYVTPATTASLPVGSTFSVQVKVSGMDQFNGWEIQVVSDRNIIRPTGISTAGNVFLANTTGGIAFELRNCVNGSGSGCCLSSCTPLDGPGIADSAYGYTKLAGGSGLLFTVTFQVISGGFTPITIQTDQFSSGGSNFVAHTTIGGIYGSSSPVSSISVSKFFTDGSLISLSFDNNGNPSVNIVLAKGIVESTNPGQILAWVNVTNKGQTNLQSLNMSDVLPVDWQVSPPWIPPQGAIHLYYANTTSLVTNPEITDPSKIAVSASNPETISVNIPNLNDTGIGHPLLPGQSILVSAKLSYGLDKTSQTFASYPRTYTDTASAMAWTGVSYKGTLVAATGSASFAAHAKVVGDVNGDGTIDIADIAQLIHAYGSHPGDANWLPSGDFFNNGVIDITDIAAAFYYYGTNS